jgi:hypothetical protein
MSHLILQVHSSSGVTEYTKKQLEARAKAEAKSYGSKLRGWHITGRSGGHFSLTVVLENCEIGVAL